jgi:hypothetical protein
VETKSVIWLVVGVVVVAAAAYFWWQQEKKTAAKMAAEAQANGWSYQRRGGSLDRKYRHLPFVNGGSKQVKHVMRGEFRGRPITVFTYQFKREVPIKRGLFEDGDRDNDGQRDTRRAAKRYGVVVVGLPEALPKLELSAASRSSARRREERLRGANILGPVVGEVLGEKTAKLLFNDSYTGGEVETGDVAFDEQFVVRSTNPDAVRALLTPQVRSWLLGSKRAQQYLAWVDENEIITWGTATDTVNCKRKATYLNDLVDQLPGGQAPGGPVQGDEVSWGPPPA